jgi:orotidine-5'-phosphate decarboxylase
VPRRPPLPVRLWLAVDTPSVDDARRLAEVARTVGAGLKLGKEFFTANGPAAVRQLTLDARLPLFLDLKFHDIPNTVAAAVTAALPLRPAMLNVHALGGAAMITAAVAAAAAAAGSERPLVLAVTILTSLGDADLPALGVGEPVAVMVERLARLARECGADGVVCSPVEAARLRASLGGDCVLVVPGVRPVWAGSDDQKRVMTPAAALNAGADALVVGRPITAAADPLAAARRLVAEIADAG